MIYLIATLVLCALMLAYFEIAKKYKIIDKPNERSSHTGLVIRGGGVVFVFGFLLSLYFMQSIAWFFVLGFVLIATVSFVDDRISLGTKPRMAAQFLAVFLLLYQLNFLALPLWLMPIIAILCVATINAYNFMDGINGINGLYSLSVWLSLLFVNYNLQLLDPEPMRFMILAILVFGFFNFRKKAKCFSGDVGSVAMAFAILYFVLDLIVKTGDISFILLLLVYGIDAFWTVVQRYLRGEKITEAHRLHLYQLLSNEKKNPHLVVASAYFVVQALVSYLVIQNHFMQMLSPWLFTILIAFIFSLLYILFKWRLMKQLGK